MPKRIKVRKVETPELQGDDSWVTLQSPTMEEYEAFGTVLKSAQAENDENAVYQQLSKFVIEWNWVDDDDVPLPQPHDNPDVFRKLTGAELGFLSRSLQSTSDVWQKKAVKTS